MSLSVADRVGVVRLFALNRVERQVGHLGRERSKRRKHIRQQREQKPE